MARNIPDRFVRPLSLLAVLPDETYSRMLSELSGDRFLNVPSALESLMGTVDPDMKEGDARELSMYLQAMTGIAISPSHRDIDDVLAEMVLGENLVLTSDEREMAKKRALGLVESEALQTLAFIMESYWKHERPVTEISMAVDIRPAFNAKHELLAMTPWQTLLISYGGESQSTQSIEFSLDREDLESLKEQVEGALAQITALESTLKSAGVRVWAMDVESGKEQ